MATEKKIAGTCYLKIDGAQVSVNGDVEFPVTLVNREARMGSTGVVGYSETDRVPFLNLTVNLEPTFPIEAVRTNDDMTLTAELANGWVYTLQGAWLEGEINGNASDGTVTLNFSGQKCHLQV
ncbi:MAG: phage tail tube protein [Succinivibrio sp.]|jgi:hypothetical protein|nr:phage tail tube protein [Succinivibrio sp.]